MVTGTARIVSDRQNPHPQAAALGTIRQRLLPALLYAVVVPYVVYRVASERFHVPAVDALLLAAVSPAIVAAGGLVRARRPNVLSLLSLLGIGAKVVAALLFHDPRLVLISDSLLHAVYGLALLGSALIGKPLLLELAVRMYAISPDQRAELAQYLQAPGFRRALTLLTAFWGAGLLLIPVISVLLTLTLPIATVVLLRPLVDYGIIGALVAATLGYRWYARRRRA